MSIIYSLTYFSYWGLSEKLQSKAFYLFLNVENLEETVTAVIYFVFTTLVRNYATDLILSNCYTLLCDRSSEFIMCKITFLGQIVQVIVCADVNMAARILTCANCCTCNIIRMKLIK